MAAAFVLGGAVGAAGFAGPVATEKPLGGVRASEERGVNTSDSSRRSGSKSAAYAISVASSCNVPSVQQVRTYYFIAGRRDKENPES